jgi:CHASE2 domain-containing sensor protein
MYTIGVWSSGSGGIGMTVSSSARANIVAFIAILTVSAGTMLWLFWRFPLMTAIITLGVFLGLGVLARLARSIDVDMTDLDRTKQRI